MNTITLLSTRSQNTATKTFHRQPDGRIKEHPYRSGTYFTPIPVEVGSIDDLYHVLQDLESEPQIMMVRGQVMPAFADQEEITRTLYDIPSKSQVAMLQPIPDGLNWMMCDFDKIDLPIGSTPQEGIEILIQNLPPEFHHVSYCYQFSSSAGVLGPKWTEPGEPAEHYLGWAKLSVHVFFWLLEKQTNMAQWAKNLNATRGVRIIDPAPLETVQPNYTARPIFVEMDDPLGAGRSGFVRKARDAVDLRWIEAPVQYVSIAGAKHVVGSTVTVSDRAGGTVEMIAAPSLQDRFDLIYPGNGRRDKLKAAIQYYFWLRGTAGTEAEIKGLLHAAFPGGIKDYLTPQKLDDLVGWFAARATHSPIYQRQANDDALLARLIEWKANDPPFPANDDTDDWVFDLENSGLRLYYIEGECGLGKTEWLIDRIGNHPDCYIVCLPRIDLIREVSKRLAAKYPNIQDTKGYVIETVYTDKENDIRDVEDVSDDAHAANSITVTEQVQRFYAKIKGKRHVVLFITHAALILTTWHLWKRFNLLVDETPDPYQAYTRDFSNSSAFIKRFVEVCDHEETNYHRLGLTDDGFRKVGDDGRFDDIEAPIRGLLESIHLPHTKVYCHRRSWDDMAAERLQLMRLTAPHFLGVFKSATIMGDEFTRSTLALAWENKYSVDWQPHPDWNPTRTRKVPLKQRARIFYFASKEERRGSVTSYEENKLIPKLLAWFDDPANDPGQVLITANRRFEHHFEKLKIAEHTVTLPDGVYTTLKQTKKVARLYKAPRLSGSDEYKAISNVAFFAAMRPGMDEKLFVGKSLLIDEEAIIRWREYNPMYQFVMRGCLRVFDSDEIANVYVFDEWQAEYLRERFGGCLEYRHIQGVLGATVKAKKGGRPKKPDGEAQTAVQRKQKQRERERMANKDATAAEAEAARALEVAPVAVRMREIMARSNKAA